MSSQTFTVRFRLPGLNEYIHAVNINRYKGNALKREAQDGIGWDKDGALKAGNEISGIRQLRVAREIKAARP